MFKMSKDKNRTTKTQWIITTLGNPKVEEGIYYSGF